MDAWAIGDFEPDRTGCGAIGGGAETSGRLTATGLVGSILGPGLATPTGGITARGGLAGREGAATDDEAAGRISDSAFFFFLGRRTRGVAGGFRTVADGDRPGGIRATRGQARGDVRHGLQVWQVRDLDQSRFQEYPSV